MRLLAVRFNRLIVTDRHHQVAASRRMLRAGRHLTSKRKLIEQGFGWAKFIGPICQVMVRGLKKVDQLFVLTMAAYNLTRMRTLEQIRLQTK